MPHPNVPPAELAPPLAFEAEVSLEESLKQASREIGFELVGIAPAVAAPGFPQFQEWLSRGFAGEMNYLPRREAAYEHPRHVLSNVRSVIMLGLNYRTADPAETVANSGRISRYAWGEGDYHDHLRVKLASLADVLHQARPGCRTRGVVDTAPLLERDFARLAGLGWFGKNTLLINRKAGSWLFLAALLTDVELRPDQPHETSHCGSCTRCLDACPTGAFPEPHVLDATRCISYLTIELRGSVPRPLRPLVGDWLFGCDVCQDVCPWNRKAPRSTWDVFNPSPDLVPLDAISILAMTADEFAARFRETPMARTGHAGMRRNACLVLGNGGDPRAVGELISALSDPEATVRESAAWGLGQCGRRWSGDSEVFLTLERVREALCRQRDTEIDEMVRAELDAALREF